jgi:hypothetical protein
MLINAQDPRQWTYLRKGQKRAEILKKKKTLVLTLGSPPEKGEIKILKKKTLVLTLGSPPEKGRKKKP